MAQMIDGKMQFDSWKDWRNYVRNTWIADCVPDEWVVLTPDLEFVVGWATSEDAAQRLSDRRHLGSLVVYKGYPRMKA